MGSPLFVLFPKLCKQHLKSVSMQVFGMCSGICSCIENWSFRCSIVLCNPSMVDVVHERHGPSCMLHHGECDVVCRHCGAFCHLSSPLVN